MTYARRPAQTHVGGKGDTTMHSRTFMIFAAALCIAAMLSYLFVFADAPVSEQPLPETSSPQ